MNRRIQIVIGLLLTAMVGAVFYFLFSAPRAVPKTMPITEQPVAATGPRDPLTGEIQITPKDFFVISVMLDNLPDVKVRPGLENASVVYEALAEGGITRLMALFESTKEVKKFGPIRSVRPYFIDWASEYGGALMHVGGSSDALRQMKTSDLFNIDQIGAGETYFTRDETIDAPHNVFSTFSSWLSFAERLKIPTQQIVPWQFAEPQQHPNTTKQQLTIAYSPANTVAWAYYPEHNTYVRFLNNERQLFSTGDQIAASNIIAIEVPSKTIDDIGRQKMQTMGQGKALLFSNGSVQTMRWIKDGKSGRMRFVADTVEEVVFTPGVSWIEVVPSLASVTQQ